ncbi:hypothetical protein JD79_03991 [Geodermatophilus normandii]|uniref:Uncharacterized protein n=1 Tax=Geodermatophilus normandii TaxID=1137989 RepID=A0A317QSU1_9ACTN|nr:hypothetical protein [Geodermatophilus normandii]PWW24800.1 hypothetical protein JD79_03991 [Geodermatophilus normandii]
MSRPTTGRPDVPPRYEIRLEGHLDARWAATFDGLSFRTEPDGTTILRGTVLDQAALHGVLQLVRDLGLPLLSLIRLDADQTYGSTPTPHQPERDTP